MADLAVLRAAVAAKRDDAAYWNGLGGKCWSDAREGYVRAMREVLELIDAEAARPRSVVDLTGLPIVDDPWVGYEQVTTWAARKRHLARAGERYTLCQRASAVRPGDGYVGINLRPITQDAIEELPLCSQCATAARKETR